MGEMSDTIDFAQANPIELRRVERHTEISKTFKILPQSAPEMLEIQAPRETLKTVIKIRLRSF